MAAQKRGLSFSLVLSSGELRTEGEENVAHGERSVYARAWGEW